MIRLIRTKVPCGDCDGHGLLWLWMTPSDLDEDGHAHGEDMTVVCTHCGAGAVDEETQRRLESLVDYSKLTMVGEIWDVAGDAE